MILMRLALAALLALPIFWGSAEAQGISQKVAVCDPAYTSRCMKPAADGSIATTPSAAATGGCTPSGLSSAATTNATSVKATAGTFCGGVAINTTATIYYLRLYNLATAPTCSSATGFVATIPIPASASGAGTLLNFGNYGAAFTAGIGYCLTGGGSSTDNTSAATGVYLAYATK